jgi:hypothetical protein
MNKKAFASAAALVLLTLCTSGSAYAQSDSALCNNALIAGTYGFTIEGNKLGGLGPVGPMVGVAMTKFDGVGHLTQIDTVTVGGVKVADFTHTPAQGTYTVNPDCTGTFTIVFTDGRPIVVTNFVVVDNGSEIDTVVISANGMPGILATSSIGKRRFSRFFDDED